MSSLESGMVGVGLGLDDGGFSGWEEVDVVERHLWSDW